MALTFLPVTITHPTDREKKTAVDFLVDSGAIYSVVPERILKKLGIIPEEERTFTLANGQTVKRRMGIARFEYADRIGGAPVVFGETGDSTLLGATTLEAMGMALNPLKRELMAMPMILG